MVLTDLAGGTAVVDQLAGRAHEVGWSQAALTLGLLLGAGRRQDWRSLGLLVIQMFRSGKEVLRGLGGIGDGAVQSVGWWWWWYWSLCVVMWPSLMWSSLMWSSGTNFVNWLHLLERHGWSEPRLVGQLWLHHAGQVDWLAVRTEVMVGQHGRMMVRQM